LEKLPIKNLREVDALPQVLILNQYELNTQNSPPVSHSRQSRAIQKVFSLTIVNDEKSFFHLA
jgi:hypothetical protein